MEFPSLGEHCSLSTCRQLGTLIITKLVKLESINYYKMAIIF